MNFWSPDLMKDMFHLDLPILEKILRPILVYFALVILLRCFGKRELAQLNPFDLVVLLSVSNTVQNAIIGNDNSLIGGVLGALTLFATNYLVVRFLFKHRRLDQILEGAPTTLIENGKVNHGSLAKELLTESELTTVIHRQGFGNLDEVEKCVLEPGGAFSIQGRKPDQDEVRHSSVLARLDAIQKQLTALENRVH